MIVDKEDSLNTNLKLCRRKRGRNGRARKRIRINIYGYLEIYRPKHHLAKKNGYIKLHRWIYEYFHKCCLLKWTMIHHINRIKTDNHRHNLLPITKAKHRAIHNFRDMSGRVCLLCGSDITYNNGKGVKNWYRHKDGFICGRCDMRKRRSKTADKSPPITIDKYLSI